MKEDERVLWYGRPRLAAYLLRLIFSLLLIIIGLVPIRFPAGVFIGIVPILIGLIILIYTIIKVRAQTYFLTNMRILQEYSLFSRSIKETTLDKITDIVFSQGFFGRILNYGKIHFHTAGTGFPGIDFSGVSDPVLVRGSVINAKDAYMTEPRPRAAPKAPSTNFCTSCGSRLEPGVLFCGSCGQKIND